MVPEEAFINNGKHDSYLPEQKTEIVSLTTLMKKKVN